MKHHCIIQRMQSTCKKVEPTFTFISYVDASTTNTLHIEHSKQQSTLFLILLHKHLNQDTYMITKKENFLVTCILQRAFASFTNGARCWLRRHHRVQRPVWFVLYAATRFIIYQLPSSAAAKCLPETLNQP